jgi:hypothetical protein
MGQERHPSYRENWGQIRAEVMYRAKRAQIAQHPDLQEELIATGDRALFFQDGNPFWDEWNAKCITRIRDEIMPDGKHPQGDQKRDGDREALVAAYATVIENEAFFADCPELVPYTTCQPTTTAQASAGRPAAGGPTVLSNTGIMCRTRDGVQQLQGYKRHIVSDHLADRYPYLEDITGHLKKDDISTAFGDRLFPRLVGQLEDKDVAPEKLVDALCLVCDLCSHQELKAQAITSDIVAAATNLLMHDSTAVRRDACRVISSVALLIGGRSKMPTGNQNLPRAITGILGAGPTLPMLIKLLLGCEDEVVKRNAAEALKALAVFRDGCQQIVDQGSVLGVAQYLCATLPDQPSSAPLAQCLLFLLQGLASVTMYARNGMRDFLGSGLIAKVITLLSRIERDSSGIPFLSREESVEAVRSAMRLLWFSGNDPRGRVEMVNAEGVKVVSSYLGDPDTKVRETAVCALNVITLETRGKEHALEHSVEPVARLLHSGEETPYLHETAVQLVRCCSELPSFRLAFARRVLDSTWLLEKLYGTTSLSPVGVLLEPHEEVQLRVRAAKVVLHFLTQAPADGDKIRVPPVCPLDNIDEPVLYALEEVVDILHCLVDLLARGEHPEAPEVALSCLGALAKAAKGREWLRELTDDGRVDVPEAYQTQVSAMVM